MTETIDRFPGATSRRAVLAAAAGAAAAFVANAVSKPASTRAAGNDGSNIVIGGLYADVQSQTTLANKANDGIVLWVASNNDLGHGNGTAITGFSASGTGIQGVSNGSGNGLHGVNNGLGTGVRGESSSGKGVYGTSESSYGVLGISDTYYGVMGQSTWSPGVRGVSTSSAGVSGDSTSAVWPAVLGQSHSHASGVVGYSGGGSPAQAKPKTGVYGTAAQDGTSKGVWGNSPAGHGLHGQSDSGWAGYFDGRVFSRREMVLQEIGTPSAPGRNKASLFIRDNGSGKTQLCVRFHTGSVRVLATQP
jgi:hypothetical protein